MISETLAGLRSYLSSSRAEDRTMRDPGLNAEIPGTMTEMDSPAEALSAALAVGDPGRRREALSALALRLTRLSQAMLYLRWSEMLQILATRTRRDFLIALSAFVPVIEALGGAEAVAETYSAIQDVSRWWP